MKRKFFTVFGGSGFIGRALVHFLKENGVKVWVPGRNDLDGAAMSGRDLGHVIYAIGSTTNFRSRLVSTVDAHAGLLSRLLEETRWNSWLYLSSTRVYGAKLRTEPFSEADPIPIVPELDSIFDLSKLLGEALCLARPEATCRVARLSHVYGAGMSNHHFLSSVVETAVSRQNVHIFEDPQSCKDYIPLEDVTHLLPRIALGGHKRLYNVASGTLIKNSEIAQSLVDIFGISVSYEPGGARRLQPMIDVARLQSEFGYDPGENLTRLRDFIQTLK